MTRLSTFDKALLNLLQGDIPICSHPFAEMANRLGTDEDTVLNRLRELKAAGFLRRIGTFFDSNRLGYHGTLVALKVKPSAICAVAEAVNRYPGATHNYEREGVYNLWFTLLTPNAEYESIVLAEIRSLNGVEDMLRLKAKKKYKINVQFKLQ
ncbi:MAG: Lrp/AsnC family transcriptional regulator [Selenomonadaceae bacterium]|nr:Lrp/AsnC family transcriptional regulator [Selenomonadaceae bacterium]